MWVLDRKSLAALFDKKPLEASVILSVRGTLRVGRGNSERQMGIEERVL